jgi:Tfp pilus assembly PilM family ATPase/Tfp pilus assembly protein PilN
MAKKMKPKGRRQSIPIVEIGNDWLKAAVFESGPEGLSISGLRLQQISRTGAPAGRELQRVFSELGVREKPIIVCLPRQIVNLRILELPSANPKEIVDMVDLQIGKLTPYSKDEVYSDFSISSASAGGYSRVMVGIVQRAVLREKYYAFEEAGLNVSRVSVSTEGLGNWVKSVYPENDCAVVDIDSFYTDFAVFSRGELEASKSILVGANQLIEDPDTWQEKLAAEIRRAMESFSAGESGAVVERIVLTGARIDGLRDYLARETGVPVEENSAFDQLKNLPEKPDLSSDTYRPVSLTAVTGMAMAPGQLGFNLIPDTAVMKTRIMDRAKSLTGLAVLLMVFLISLTAYGSLKVGFKMAELELVQRRLKEIKPLAEEVERKQEMTRIARERQDPRRSFVSLLNSVHGSVPEGVSIEELSFDRKENRLLLDGLASRADISRLVEKLQNSAMFTEARERNTRYDSDADMYRFQVVAGLEPGEK